MNQNYKLDPVLKLLAAGLVFFSVVVIFCDWRFKDDGQVFQVFSNLLSGFGGALLMRVKPATKEEEKPGVTESTEHTDTVLVTKPVQESKGAE